EYLSEELVVQRSNHKTYAPYHVDPSPEEDQLDMENNDEIIAPDHHQHAAASDFDPTSTGHPCDIDGDAEPNIEEETVGTRRGKTKLKHVWNIPKGHRIVVKCNEFDQPIGEEAGVLGKFLGMVARNGCLCRFLYPARMEKWVLRTIGDRWRQHKSNLKSIYFDVHKSKEANYKNVPEGVIPDQWIALVNNWMTLKAQKNPHRVVLYIHTHRANSSKNINAHVGDLKDLLVQQPDLADTSQGKVAWKGDALTRILGEEKPGRVHGLGLVPNPDKVLDCSKSGRLKHLNITSLDPTSSEDVVSLRLQVEKLVNHVQNLEQKTKDLEQQQNQHGGSGDPLSAATNAHNASKRKVLYVEPQSQEYGMHDRDTLNYTMGEQTDDDGFQDLQSRYKRNYAAEK
ncbi:hypothetical protein ACJX0J_033699, partial [Zea mays]